MKLATASRTELNKIRSLGYFTENQICGSPRMIDVVAGTVTIDRKNQTVNFTDEHDNKINIPLSKIMIVGVK